MSEIFEQNIYDEWHYVLNKGKKDFSIYNFEYNYIEYVKNDLKLCRENIEIMESWEKTDKELFDYYKNGHLRFLKEKRALLKELLIKLEKHKEYALKEVPNDIKGIKLKGAICIDA